MYVWSGVNGNTSQLDNISFTHTQQLNLLHVMQSKASQVAIVNYESAKQIVCIIKYSNIMQQSILGVGAPRAQSLSQLQCWRWSVLI